MDKLNYFIEHFVPMMLEKYWWARGILVLPGVILFTYLLLYVIYVKRHRKHVEKTVVIYNKKDIKNIINKFQNDIGIFKINESRVIEKDFVILEKELTYTISPRKPKFRKKTSEMITSIEYYKKV